MKLTIILEKKSRFNIDLPEVEANKLYQSVIGSILSEIREEPYVSKAPHISLIREVAKKVEPVDLVSEPEVETLKEEIVKTIEDKPTAISKGLVMMRCSGCKDTLVSVVNSGQWSLTCKSCKTNNTLENLKPAAYICPNCGYKASFHVKEGLNMVKCKNCSGDIDLLYHEKKEKYLSANLVK